MSPPIRVVVPTHGRPDLLRRTLQSFSECHLPENYRELIVVENGSRAGAESLVEEMPESYKARYENVEHANKSHALNKSLQTFDDESLVVFLDDDVRLHPEVLVAYAEAAEKCGRGTFFGGPVRIDAECQPAEWLLPFYPFSVRGYDLIHSRIGRTYLGFNWAAFSADIKHLGGFDSRFGPGSPTGATGQEIDMQFRMLEAGFQAIDVAEAIVWHYVPPERMTFRWLVKRMVQGGRKPGMRSNRSAPEFALNFTRETLVSLGVAVKSILLLDKRKLAFVVLNTAERVGTLQGYLWNRRQQSESKSS